MDLDTTLYFITDSTGFDEDTLLLKTEEAIRGGAARTSARRPQGTRRRSDPTPAPR